MTQEWEAINKEHMEGEKVIMESDSKNLKIQVKLVDCSESSA